MKHIKLFENWEKDTINYNKVDKYKILITKGSLNSFEYRMTDDSLTYDHMMKQYDRILGLILDLNHTELFELIIGLNKNGIKHLEYEFFDKWVKTHKGDYGLTEFDIKSLKRAISVRMEKL